MGGRIGSGEDLHSGILRPITGARGDEPDGAQSPFGKFQPHARAHTSGIGGASIHLHAQAGTSLVILLKAGIGTVLGDDEVRSAVMVEIGYG